MAISSFTQGVDFNLGRILLFEDLVKVLEGLCSLFLSLFSLETKLLCDTKCLLKAEAICVVNWGSDDSTWVLRSDFLNVHTSLA